MKFSHALSLLSLLLLPIVIHCMEKDESTDEITQEIGDEVHAALKVHQPESTDEITEEREHPVCVAWEFHDEIANKQGREIAARFTSYLLNKYARLFGPLGLVLDSDEEEVKQDTPIYYDFRNDVIAQLLAQMHDQTAPEQAQMAYDKLKVLYNGMNQELVLGFLDFLRLVNSNKDYPVDLKIMLKHLYERAIDNAQTMCFKVRSREELIQAIAKIKNSVEQQESFYHRGKQIGMLKCKCLEKFGLRVQKLAEWEQLNQAFLTEIQTLHRTIENLSQTHDDVEILQLWRSAYQGFYEPLLLLKPAVYFAHTLQYVDLSTQDTQELEKIKNLNRDLNQERNSTMSGIGFAFMCQDAQAILSFINERKGFQND
jgi:hypothetical protein